DGNTVDSYDASSLADGGHTVSITDTDAAGNSSSSSVDFTLDTTISTASVTLTNDTGGNNSDGLTNDDSLTFIAVDADATRVVTVDGNTVASYDASSLADGAHTVSITDTDAAGNSSSSSVDFTLDTTLSTASVTLTNDTGDSTSDGLTNDASLTFSAVDADATRVIT